MMANKNQAAPQATSGAGPVAATTKDNSLRTTTNINEQPLLSAALSYAEAGLSVIPCDRQTKAPLSNLLPNRSWNPYRERIAALALIRGWFANANGRIGIAVICGAVSGNVEIIDHDAPSLFSPWCELVEDLSPGLLSRLVILQTQSDKRHIAYKCPVIGPNDKLAQRWIVGADGKPKKVTLVETRGEGGYALTWPTKGYVPLQGTLTDLPTITPDERAILLSASRAFHQATKDNRPGGAVSTPSDGLRPGDDFNERGDPLSILEQRGWLIVHRRGDVVHLRRPGKDQGGCSATWNHIPRRFYVFTTNGHPFEPERAYTPFAVHALLEHNGDYTAAARELAAQGYGKQAVAELLRPTATIEADDLESSPDPIPVYCPPLPKVAQIDPALGDGAGKWVEIYTRYATAVSPMTPVMFHESAALWLGSVAIARRLVLPMHFASIYPNLFVAWVAPTTLYRKSTSLDVARGIVRRIFPHLVTAQDVTPEAFLSDMAGQEPSNYADLTQQDQAEWRAGRDYAAQKGWVLDEMSGLLAAGGKDYNAGLVETLLRFYDCDPHYVRSTRNQGRVVVRNAYLAMLGASTPAAMAHHLTSERLWGMGWWPRFAILTPERHPNWRTAQYSNEPSELANGLLRLHSRLPASAWPDPPDAKGVTLDDGVYAAWERYNKALSYDLLVAGDVESQLYGTYGRMPVQALKVATILAALDWPDVQNSPCIKLCHLARAISICESWRASAHRALALAKESESDRLQERIRRCLARFGLDGATLRDIYKSLRGTKREKVEEALKQLVATGEVEAIEVPPGEKGGRPTTRYRLVAE